MKPVTYADHLQAMLSVQRRLHNAEQSLKQLDLSDFEALEDQLIQLKADEQAQELRLKELENARVEVRAKPSGSQLSAIQRRAGSEPGSAGNG